MTHVMTDFLIVKLNFLQFSLAVYIGKINDIMDMVLDNIIIYIIEQMVNFIVYFAKFNNYFF